MTSEGAGPVLREVSEARFDAFAGYARAPEVALVAEEIGWFESPSSDVFALLIVDHDQQFSGIVFVADLDGRFRWATQTTYFNTIPGAVEALGLLAAHVLTDIDAFREQGDESGAPTDFFRPRVPTQRQHPSFRQVADGKGHHAARALIEVLMRWYEDRDGNFIEQFQSTGFDARVWELYLWATFVSLGYEVTMPKPSPDFIARGLDGSFAIEATTINPTKGPGGRQVVTPRPTKPDDFQAYAEHYLPIRYAGPLTAKLAKRYWEQPAVAGLPLVFAIQDFHDEFSMTFSQGGLVAYLFGISLHDVVAENGRTARINEHVWGSKVVPSGFFTLPDAEHVSAVMFNSQGTISKFTRMAVKCGFDPSGVHIVHTGLRLEFPGGEPQKVQFSGPVDVDYPEDWIDGMDVFHNPNAVNPLDPNLIPGAAHHILTPGGNITTLYPDGHLLTSTTGIVVPTAGASREDAAPSL
ncbi:MAG: hypothetical protein ACSLE6_14595 [Mycobacterium sp.]